MITEVIFTKDAIMFGNMMSDPLLTVENIEHVRSKAFITFKSFPSNQCIASVREGIKEPIKFVLEDNEYFLELDDNIDTKVLPNQPTIFYCVVQKSNLQRYAVLLKPEACYSSESLESIEEDIDKDDTMQKVSEEDESSDSASDNDKTDGDDSDESYSDKQDEEEESDEEDEKNEEHKSESDEDYESSDSDSDSEDIDGAIVMLEKSSGLVEIDDGISIVLYEAYMRMKKDGVNVVQYWKRV